MKAQLKQTVFSFLLLGLFIAWMPLQAENDSHYFSVNGVVKDKSNNKKLEFVTVSIPGTNIGTVTNDDGEFTLKIKDSLKVNQIELSRVGYYSQKISVNGNNIDNQTFYLNANPKVLNEIVVKSWNDPAALVLEAIKRIEKNYSNNPSLLTGFYRETAKKGRNYINISEAIINIYKTEYSKDAYSDRVNIYKGRKLLSEKASDTLAVKLLGGPNLSINADFVKNPEVLFDQETMYDYKFKMEMPTAINDRPQFVVSFEPQVILPYPLFNGKLYIDQETLAFTSAEFSLDMKDRNKVTEVILKQKPRGLRFKPEEVSFLVNYQLRNGKAHLNYIRNEIRFKCDWKRRLFATNYTVMSEMVVTESKGQNVAAIPRKESFNANESLSDKVMSFYDENFWGSYNIIEPTESLDSAVKKLKKQREN